VHIIHNPYSKKVFKTWRWSLKAETCSFLLLINTIIYSYIHNCVFDWIYLSLWPAMCITCHLCIPHSNDTTATFLGRLLGYFTIVYRLLNFTGMTTEIGIMWQEVSVVNVYVTTSVCSRNNKEILDKLATIVDSYFIFISQFLCCISHCCVKTIGTYIYIYIYIIY
jgi:hypothetical protein